jgi:hypothetical protein
MSDFGKKKNLLVSKSKSKGSQTINDDNTLLFCNYPSMEESMKDFLEDQIHGAIGTESCKM